MYLPSIVALAAVATIGYLMGRRSQQQQPEYHGDRARRELKRARAVAGQLEEIADRIRKNLATHQSSIAKFKDRVSELSSQEERAAWCELFHEAETMVKPTLDLAAQISCAYDELRQQTSHLMTFTETRSDQLTGVSNRKALDETLESSFALLTRYDQGFALAIFDIDHFKQINDVQGHVLGDQILQKVARILDDETRETDLVARYGGEEFVVVMPHTDLEGASCFAEKIRLAVANSGLVTISGGVAEASHQDDPKMLLARSDAALYAAKAAGRNRIHCNTGISVEPYLADTQELPAISAAEALSS
ncbi:MAG TPA: GGDEF domain-containing protein [Pirellulales bacterium]|nr:GGDEF domain-containing protein [Pirellulales bacterium]